MTNLIGVDLGAESGRVMLGRFDGARLAVECVHRFPNTPLTHGAYRCWNLPALCDAIGVGIARASESCGGDVAAIGVDTWGVDYGLLDADGELLHPPISHRDPRTIGIDAQVRSLVSDDELFARTGTALLPFNTIYQLVATRAQHPELLDRARRMLFIPDLIHHWLTGVAANELTEAGTSGLLAAGKNQWDQALIAQLGLPAHLFGELVAPGSTLGVVRPELRRVWNLRSTTPVVLPAGHDTASAVAAMPSVSASAAYLSSGTWSLLGAVRERAALSPEVRAAGFGNEIAADGRVRLNHNIMGLWVVQECRRAFVAAGRDRDYATLTQLAAAAPAPAATLAVNDPRFFTAGTAADTMPARVQAWFRERSLPAPADDGAIIRAVLEGLADAYRRGRDDLQRFTGQTIDTIHILGGGGRNQFLNQLTANACACRVIAGPDEATALGNLLVQLVGLGRLNWNDLPQVVAASAECVTYRPQIRGETNMINDGALGFPSISPQ